MIFQVIGGILGSTILFILVSTGSYSGPTMTGSNGFGEGEMLQAFIAKTVFTFIFVLVALGATDKRKGAGKLAGLAIGLTLILVHNVCIVINNNDGKEDDWSLRFSCHPLLFDTLTSNIF